VDYYWSKLSEGGSEIQCGWSRTSSACAGRLCPRASPISLSTQSDASMLQMTKLDIAELERAAKS